MKSFDEIRTLPHFISNQTAADGGSGYLFIDWKNPNKAAVVVYSTGGGWDHVSVSFEKRCPTRDEMCMVKRMFFKPDETVIQYHPIEDEYVNNHPYCLHLWRPQAETFPTPPSWMVGLKKGQTYGDIKRAAAADGFNIEGSDGQ